MTRGRGEMSIQGSRSTETREAGWGTKIVRSRTAAAGLVGAALAPPAIHTPRKGSRSRIRSRLKWVKAKE